MGADAASAAQAAWNAANAYSIAENDDAVARENVAAAMRARFVEAQAEAVASAAAKAQAQAIKNANRAEAAEASALADSKASTEAMMRARNAQAQAFPSLGLMPKLPLKMTGLLRMPMALLMSSLLMPPGNSMLLP